MLHHLTDVLLAFGPLGVFLLAVVDSFGVPIPFGIDVLVAGIAAKSAYRGWISAGLAVIGSLCGNIGLFQAARQGGRRFMKVPEPGEKRKFREWFARYGLLTVFVPALVPIPLPLKVFVISAGVLHTRFSRFLAVILTARMIRYFGEAYLGMKLGQEGATTYLKHNAWTLAGVALAAALVLYGLMRLNERRTNRELRTL